MSDTKANTFHLSLATAELLLDLALLAKTCCDKPDDRMFHAADQTWWRRDGMRWVAAEAPDGWHEMCPGEWEMVQQWRQDEPK